MYLVKTKIIEFHSLYINPPSAGQYIYGLDVAWSLRGTLINTVCSCRDFDRRLPPCFLLGNTKQIKSVKRQPNSDIFGFPFNKQTFDPVIHPGIADAC